MGVKKGEKENVQKQWMCSGFKERLNTEYVEIVDVFVLKSRPNMEYLGTKDVIIL